MDFPKIGRLAIQVGRAFTRRERISFRLSALHDLFDEEAAVREKMSKDRKLIFR